MSTVRTFALNVYKIMVFGTFIGGSWSSLEFGYKYGYHNRRVIDDHHTIIPYQGARTSRDTLSDMSWTFLENLPTILTIALGSPDILPLYYVKDSKGKVSNQAFETKVLKSRQLATVAAFEQVMKTEPYK